MTSKPVEAVAISEEPLDVSDAIARAGDPGAGGLGVFVGTVRITPAGPGGDRSVVRLEYEAHPTLALEAMEEIAREAKDKWDLHAVIARHRTGSCDVGDPTVVVVCASAHRAPALEAARWVIDEIKTRVPIWKKEIYGDGSSWIGAEDDGSRPR